MDIGDATDDAVGVDGLGSLIKVANTLIEKELNNRVASMFGEYSLTGPQITLLVYLYDAHGRTVTQREVADRFVLSHPTVRGIVRRLESARLITSSRMESDRRQIVLGLTDEGWWLIDAHIVDIRDVMAQVDGRIVNGLGKTDREKLAVLLKRVVVNFSQ